MGDARNVLLLLAGALLPDIEGVLTAALPELPLSDADLKVHAGYYSDGGKYLGGIPGYKNMYEMFDCTDYMYDFSYGNAGGIAKICQSWIANAVGSSAGYDVARCSCQSVKDKDYCEAWSCSHFDVYTPFSCSGSDYFCYVERQVRSTQCLCEAESHSGNFCSSWTCLDTEGTDDTAVEGGVMTEEYNCVTTSPTADFCVAWTGVIDTADTLALSTCSCVQDSTANSVCSHWECQMRGMDKCSRAGSGWCNIDYAVGVGGLFGSFGAIFAAVGLFRFLNKQTPIYRYSGLDYFLGFAWMALWSIGVVIWGGEDGAIYVTLWWMSIIAIGVLCGCYAKSFGREQRGFVCL